MAKKLIEWDHIAYVYDELWELKAQTINNLKIYNRISELLKYIEDNFEDKENLNEIKRDVYMKIKTAKTAEERQQWYEIYQELKHQSKQN